MSGSRQTIATPWQQDPRTASAGVLLYPSDMADLLTLETLARWTQEDPVEVAADPFAVDLIDKLSQLICYLGGHPDWSLEVGPDRVPIDVEMVMLQVAKRSYENPDQIVQESVGPLSERKAEVAALFMSFTDAERATITKHNPAGDPNTPVATLYTIVTTRGSETTLPQISPLYVGDNQQINLESSADPREWKIPLFNPGDPGDDANYDTE